MDSITGINNRELYSSLLGCLAVAVAVASFAPSLLRPRRDIDMWSLAGWLVSDALSLTALILLGLLYTQIAWAAWAILADLIIVAQALYFRSSSLPTVNAVANESQTTAVDANTSTYSRFRRRIRADNFLSLLFAVLCAGAAVVVWSLAVFRSRRTYRPREGANGFGVEISLPGYVLAWLHLASHACMRVAQVYFNWSDAQAQAYGMRTYILALLEMALYLASICVFSTAHSFLAVEAPWLTYAAFNILVDNIIRQQYLAYRKPSPIMHPFESDSFDGPKTSTPIRLPLPDRSGALSPVLSFTLAPPNSPAASPAIVDAHLVATRLLSHGRSRSSPILSSSFSPDSSSASSLPMTPTPMGRSRPSRLMMLSDAQDRGHARMPTV